MGWSISIKEDKTETKYRIWSSVTDSYISEWMNVKECVKFLFWDKFRKFMFDFIEDATTFPNGWSVKDKNEIITNEARGNFYDFKIKAISDDKLFTKKFKEELDKLGIEISVTDGKHGLSNINKKAE